MATLTQTNEISAGDMQPVCAATLRADVPLHAACPATTLHRRTRRPGGVLLHSARGEARTVVVTRAALRITVRGNEARVRALEPGVELLLDELARRLPGAQVVAGLLTLRLNGEERAALDEESLRQPSLFDPLRALAGLVVDRDPDELPPGFYGAFAFDLVDRFEALGPRKPDRFDDADIEGVLALDTVSYERGVARVRTRGLPWESMASVKARHRGTLARLQQLGSTGELPFVPCAAAPPDRPADEFLASVAVLREHIARGDVYQAVLSRSVEWRSESDSLAVFERLRAREPAPYAFHLELEHGALFGSSPETCVAVDADGVLEIHPVAGTAPRGVDPDTDCRLALALLFDRKEQAEHVMLVDLARNDIARVAVPGTTHVVEQLAVAKYSRVQHLVSRVQGRLRPGLDALHAYRAAANMGTLTGAPKVRAAEIVRALEPSGRGFYGGAVGYMLADGRFDSCIVIRSLRCLDGAFRGQAGAGIVWNSDAQREFDETERKLQAVREVMEEMR